MILRELIERSLDSAVAGQDTTATRLAAEAAVEPLLPVVFSATGEHCAGIERLRSLLRRTKLLAFVNGAVTLDGDVLTAYITEGSLLDPLDKTKRYAYAPWEAFTKDSDQRLGYFSIEVGTTLHVVEPATNYDPAAGPTVSLLLTTPCTPSIPATVEDALTAPFEVLDDLQVHLTDALRLAIAKR